MKGEGWALCSTPLCSLTSSYDPGVQGEASTHAHTHTGGLSGSDYANTNFQTDIKSTAVRVKGYIQWHMYTVQHQRALPPHLAAQALMID